MTRRAGLHRGRVTPGLSNAVAVHAREFADRWPTPGSLARAEAAERGDDLVIDGLTVWFALRGARSPLAARFLHDDSRYLLTAPDQLTEAEG